MVFLVTNPPNVAPNLVCDLQSDAERSSVARDREQMSLMVVDFLQSKKMGSSLKRESTMGFLPSSPSTFTMTLQEPCESGNDERDAERTFAAFHQHL